MLEVMFVSDYVCPYCLVAKEALRAALAAEGLTAHFTWQPYELTEEPRERVDTYHDATRRAHYQVLEAPCRQLGLDMKLPPQVVPRPYSRLAFEGWLYACDKGRGEEYNDRVYRAYFIEEKDIGDAAVLTALAAGLGLDAADFAAALAEGRYTAAEKAAVAYARDTLQTKSVPGIYFDGAPVYPADYSVEAMRRLLQDWRQQKQAEKDTDAAPAFGCNENGCGLAGHAAQADDEPEAGSADGQPTFGCNENGCGLAGHAAQADNAPDAGAADGQPTFGCNENGCG